MTDNFKEIGSLFGREGAGAGFAKQTDKESFTYAFAWPEGDTWATLTGYLNLSVETHDMASGKDALLADAPQRDAPAKDTQNIG